MSVTAHRIWVPIPSGYKKNKNKNNHKRNKVTNVKQNNFNKVGRKPVKQAMLCISDIKLFNIMTCFFLLFYILHFKYFSLLHFFSFLNSLFCFVLKLNNYNYKLCLHLFLLTLFLLNSTLYIYLFI